MVGVYVDLGGTSRNKKPGTLWTIPDLQLQGGLKQTLAIMGYTVIILHPEDLSLLQYFHLGSTYSKHGKILLSKFFSID